MSIITQWNNSFPMSLRGIADTTTCDVVSAILPEPSFEICVCDGCDFVETQFVNHGGTWYENDKKSFIYSKRFSSDTITFNLYKGGVQIAVLNDSTYCDYYNFGSAFLINPNYKGIVIDWDKVQQSFGYGMYYVKTVVVSLGTTYEYDSHNFEVVEYNPLRADRSVRLEWYQSGVIMSGFDYSGIGWYQSLRIDGFFGKKTPELNIDNYQDKDRRVKQIQTKIINSYTLTTHLLPSYIGDLLNEDSILANDIYITDYNLLNSKLYRRFNVYVSDIKNVEHHNFSKRTNYIYEFKGKKDNVIKRNIDGDFAMLPTEQSTTKLIEDKSIILVFSFDSGEGETTLITIDSNSEASYSATTNDGSSGTITFSKNGGAYASFTSPLNLAIGDTIQVKRTTTTAIGNVNLSGLRA